MFGKKTANGYSEEKDLQLLMQAMDGVIGGNYEDIDTMCNMCYHILHKYSNNVYR